MDDVRRRILVSSILESDLHASEESMCTAKRGLGRRSGPCEGAKHDKYSKLRREATAGGGRASCQGQGQSSAQDPNSNIIVSNNAASRAAISEWPLCVLERALNEVKPKP